MFQGPVFVFELYVQTVAAFISNWLSYMQTYRYVQLVVVLLKVVVGKYFV